jgi:hypothetical protein
MFITDGDEWARLDSNQRPSDYESPALTTAPRARLSVISDQQSVATVCQVTDHWSLLPERETGFEPADISLEG